MATGALVPFGGAKPAADVGTLRVRVFKAEVVLADGYQGRGYVAIEVKTPELTLATDAVASTSPEWNREFTLPLSTDTVRVTLDLVYYFQLGHTREVLGRATLDIARSVKVEEEWIPLIMNSSKYLKQNGRIKLAYEAAFNTSFVVQRADPDAMTVARMQNRLSDHLVTLSVYYYLAKHGVTFVLELMSFMHGLLSIAFCVSFWIFIVERWVPSWALCWTAILLMQLRFDAPADPREMPAEEPLALLVQSHRAWREVGDAVDWFGEVFLFGAQPTKRDAWLGVWLLLTVTVLVVPAQWLVLLLGLFQCTLGMMYYHRPAARLHWPPVKLASLAVDKAVRKVSVLLDQPAAGTSDIPHSGELYIRVLRANTLLRGPATPPSVFVSVAVEGESRHTPAAPEGHWPEFPGESWHWTVLHRRTEIRVALVALYGDEPHDLGTAVFCTSALEREGKTEVLQVHDLLGESAGYVVINYQFKEREWQADQNENALMHAFIERKFADYGQLVLTAVEGRKLDPGGPFHVDILVDGEHRRRTHPSTPGPSPGSCLFKDNKLKFHMDSRMVELTLKLYDVGGSQRVKIGQGSTTVQGKYAKDREEWVPLTSRAGKPSGEVLIRYRTYFHDDVSLLASLSDEANEELWKVPPLDTTPIPQEELYKALARFGFYRALGRRMLDVLASLILHDVSSWSMYFAFSFLFACVAHRLVGFTMAWLAVAGYLLQIHPLLDARTLQYRECSDQQLCHIFQVTQYVALFATRLDDVGQRAVFWRDEQTWVVVHGFVCAAVLVLVFTLHWPLTLLGVYQVGTGLAYYGMPDLKKQYPPEEMFGRVLIPLLGWNPLRSRDRAAGDPDLPELMRQSSLTTV